MLAKVIEILSPTEIKVRPQTGRRVPVTIRITEEQTKQVGDVVDFDSTTLTLVGEVQ